MEEKKRFNRQRRSLLHSAICLGASAGIPMMGRRALAATSWPTRPVKLVVAVAAGSTGDSLMRMMAPKLEAIWKQPVVVENRPGAGGIVGTQYVVNATDDHTVMLATLSSVLPKFTVKDLRYDPATDLVPIYRIIDYDIVMVATPELINKAPTLKDIVALSRSTPDGLFFAGTGPTSIFNMMMAVLNKSLDVNYTSVDFNNIPNMLLALMRGDAHLSLSAPFNIRAQIEAGQLVPVAAIAKRRFPVLPDVPAITEAVDYQGHVPLSWGGFFGPKSLPKEIVEIIGRDTGIVLSDPEFKREIEKRLGGQVLQSSPQEFEQGYKDELKMWGEVLTSLGIKPA